MRINPLSALQNRCLRALRLPREKGMLVGRLLFSKDLLKTSPGCSVREQQCERQAQLVVGALSQRVPMPLSRPKRFGNFQISFG